MTIIIKYGDYLQALASNISLTLEVKSDSDPAMKLILDKCSLTVLDIFGP